MRILVVDDEPAVREAVERALRLDGHDVLIAADGGAALDSLTDAPPDAVVLDVQFLAESLILAGLGGVCGVALGSAVTVAYATSRDWPSVVPPAALGAGVGAALAIGALAGIYPALRAAHLAPTEALRSV